jgi:hypothetical protein
MPNGAAWGIQVGVGGTGGVYVHGIQAHIGEPQAEYNKGSAYAGEALAYWIAESFSDGDFVQAGYYDALDDSYAGCGSFQRFYEAIDAGNNGAYDTGAPIASACGMTGEKVVRLEIISPGPPRQYAWVMNGVTIDTFYQSHAIALQDAGAYSEDNSDASHTHVTGSLGEVHYTNLEMETTSGTLVNWSHANYHYYDDAAHDATCPPYVVYSGSSYQSDVFVDPFWPSGSCHSNGATDW